MDGQKYTFSPRVFFFGGFLFFFCSILFLFFLQIFGPSPVAQDAVPARIEKKKDASSFSQKTLSYWTHRINTVGAEAAYAQMKNSFAAETYGVQHAVAHLLGIALYRQYGVEGVTYCDDAFTYGCYHSFFAAALEKEGDCVLPHFVTACQKKWGDKSGPCFHGIGHGILLSLGYEQFSQALQMCTDLGGNQPFACESGVFMENNFRMGEPGGEEQSVQTRVMDPNNLFAPCIHLDGIYKEPCYFWQVHWWEAVTGGEYDHILSLCEQLEDEKERIGCFSGVGNHSIIFYSYDGEKTVDLCARISREQESSACRHAAAVVVLFQKKDTTLAINICAAYQKDRMATCQTRLEQNPFWEERKGTNFLIPQ